MCCGSPTGHSKQTGGLSVFRLLASSVASCAHPAMTLNDAGFIVQVPGFCLFMLSHAWRTWPIGTAAAGTEKAPRMPRVAIPKMNNLFIEDSLFEAAGPLLRSCVLRLRLGSICKHNL